MIPAVACLLDLPGRSRDPRCIAALERLHGAVAAGHTGLPVPELDAGTVAALRAGGWAGPAAAGLPLVVEDGWIAPRRAWVQEHRLATVLAARATRSFLPDLVADPAIHADLDALFPATPFARSQGGVDWQRLAAATALARGLCLITGGPGTGKTTVAGRWLTALARHHARIGRPDPQVVLAAPTGKAASRLRDAVAEALAGETAAGRLPAERATRLTGSAMTLHRWLRHPDPAGVGVLVIDEASMADTALLDGALARLPAEARLVVLGDPDQLAAVAPGRALADLCDLPGGGCDAAMAAWYRSGCADPVTVGDGGPVATTQVRLQATWRSKDAPDLASLAADLRDGRWRVPAGGAVVRCDLPSPDALLDSLWNTWSETIHAALSATDPARAADLLDGFRWLCALRQGPWGCTALAAALERRLAASGAVRRDADGHYHGRPLLITANRPDLGLANGDQVLVWEGVAVPPDGRRIPLHRLGEVASAWALTVHQSQGSQYARVEVVTAPDDRPVLGRELLYTAVTRARRGVRVWGAEDLLATVASRRSERRGRLAALLGGARAQ